MEKIKKLMICIAICLLFLIISLIVLNYRDKNLNLNEKEKNVIPELKPSEGVLELENRNLFFSIENSLKEYLNSMNEQEKIKAMLDEEYIKDKEVILQKHNKIIFQAKEMYIKDKIDFAHIYVKGKNTVIDNSVILENVYFLVMLDRVNNTISITPIDDEKKFEENLTSRDVVEKTIAKNKYNKFYYKSIDIKEYLEKLLEAYRMDIMYDTTSAYNTLEESCKVEKFDTIEKYKKYLEENKKELANIALSQYFTQKRDDYVEYTCVDQYENKYIFKVEGVMKYSVSIEPSVE